MLNIHNLSVAFGGEYLFEEISFRLNGGDRVGLIGKNGAGKSTMLKLLAKEMPLDQGTIAIEITTYRAKTITKASLNHIVVRLGTLSPFQSSLS